MIFALSSSCTDAPITLEGCLALSKQQARLARWWGIAPSEVRYTTRLGQIDDPGCVDVHVMPDWSGEQFVGIPATDIAYHTVSSDGRPVCFISWAAVQVNGGTLTGPGGLWSAIGHEMCESAIDPECDRLIANPAGKMELVEVCDRIQGNDYEEPGSEGIYLSDALGPAAWSLATPKDAAVSIASDLGKPVYGPFPLLPGGYYAPIDGPPVFGEAVSAIVRERLTRLGARSGWVKALRALQSR